MKKIISLLLAVIMVASLLPVMAFADVTLGNNGYPYAESSVEPIKITLSPVVSGEPSTYTWEYSDTKDGTYTPFTEITDVVTIVGEKITIAYDETDNFNEKWVRCSVDGTYTTPVQIIYPYGCEYIDDYYVAKDGSLFDGYKVCWYVSNGYIMYSYIPEVKEFDVLGKYTASDGKNHWLTTAYHNEWFLHASDSDSPEPEIYNEYMECPQAIYVSFGDDHELAFEVVLKEGQHAFAIATDLQLGGDEDYMGCNPDYAAIKATLDNGNNLENIQVVGVEKYADLKNDTAAFVFTTNTVPSNFGIGCYRYIEAYSYFFKENGYEGDYEAVEIGGKDVAVQVENEDTGMSVSWLNLEGGATVKFSIAIGTAGEAGAFEEEPEEPEPEEPERKHKNTDTVTIGDRDDSKEETKADEKAEENPNTGAPVMNLGALAVVLGAVYVISKKH